MRRDLNCGRRYNIVSHSNQRNIKKISVNILLPAAVFNIIRYSKLVIFPIDHNLVADLTSVTAGAKDIYKNKVHI